MENIDILLLLISVVIGLSVTKEVFSIHKNSTSSNESNRFFKKMSNAESASATIGSSVYTKGLTLAKSKKDGKYDLIAQSKLCDIGLS